MKLSYSVSKRTLIFFTTFISFSLSASSSKIAKLKKSTDSNHFFPISGKTLLIPQLGLDENILGDLSSKNLSNIRKISSKYLNEIGLKEGSIIQSIDVLNGGVKAIYKIRKEVNIVLFKDIQKDTTGSEAYWTSINLILSDNKADLVKLSEPGVNLNEIIGFGYTGSLRILRGDSLKEISTVSVSSNNPIYRLPYSGFEKNKEPIKLAQLFKHKLFVQPQAINGGRVDVPVIEDLNGNFYHFSAANKLLNDTKNSLKVGTWIKDFKVLPSFDPYEDECYSLILFSPTAVEEISMRCK